MSILRQKSIQQLQATVQNTLVTGFKEAKSDTGVPVNPPAFGFQKIFSPIMYHRLKLAAEGHAGIVTGWY